MTVCETTTNDVNFIKQHFSQTPAIRTTLVALLERLSFSDHVTL